MTKFLHTMVDIETTGLDPIRSAIIQIAAVRFDLESGTVMPNGTFDESLIIPYGRAWDEDTRQWWLKDKRHILEEIQFRAKQPAGVIDRFIEFLNTGRDPSNDDLIFWSKPTHFDFAFMESYFKQFGKSNPFKFWLANDLNSFIRGQHFPDDPPNYMQDIDFKGDAHNALNDALHQLRILFACRTDALTKMSFMEKGIQA